MKQTNIVNILGVILLCLAALAPASQLLLVNPSGYSIEKAHIDTVNKWISGNWFREGEEKEKVALSVVTDKSLREDIYEITPDESRILWNQYGIPYGRSHPPINSEIGADIVIDGKASSREKDNINSFWSFDPHFLPVQLDIIKTTEKKWINWICIIPRAEWQIAYDIDVIQGQHNTHEIIPLHYNAYRPVKYRFDPEYCNGIRITIRDTKVAYSNSWGAPIFEIGAGCEGDICDEIENTDS